MDEPQHRASASILSQPVKDSVHNLSGTTYRPLRRADQYSDWDFLKSHESQVCSSEAFRTGRRLLSHSHSKDSFNIIAPPPTTQEIEDSYRVLSITELASGERPRSIARTPPPQHIRNMEELAYGSWCGASSPKDARPSAKKNASSITGEAYTKRKILGNPSRQDILQEKLREETGKDYYQVISVSDLAQEQRSRGVRRVTSPQKPAASHPVTQHKMHEYTEQNPSDELLACEEEQEILPPDMKPNKFLRFKGLRKRGDDMIGYMKEREDMENTRTRLADSRQLLAKERALKQAERNTDVIRNGLLENPNMHRPTKKMFEVNCSTQTAEDNSRMFGPHMRRFAPPPPSSNLDEINQHRGIKQITPQNDQPPPRPPHRSSNRPSTALGRSQGSITSMTDLHLNRTTQKIN
eukprot:TRINITY_DN3104_c0_g1_i5.p1 TRINITY_DN3104_c0_g1~~TRINITY_DN3104_c0_g1_i5.p1  ORF type:complete len:409 (-),score=82.28 TRINITY_DN3104_c0_g1_i5:617-1843(-)